MESGLREAELADSRLRVKLKRKKIKAGSDYIDIGYWLSGPFYVWKEFHQEHGTI